MAKTLAAFAALMMVIVLITVLGLAMNAARDPAALRTVEYLADSEAALADRAGMRVHVESMARIEADRAEKEEFYSTLRIFGVALIVVVGVLAALVVMNALRGSEQRMEPRLAGPGRMTALPYDSVVDGEWRMVVPPAEEERRLRRLTGGD